METTAAEPAPFRVEPLGDDITRLVLDRPDRLNAMTWPMIDALLETFAELRADRRLRVVVLTGAGRGFSAGLDIKQRDDALGGDDDVFTVYERQEKVAALATAVRAIRAPVIAAVNGPAAGGGLALALAADLRVCAPEATFTASFVRIGLSACDVGVSYLLPRLVGFGVASEIMLTGRSVGAEEALAIGLVNRLVATDELEASTLELASLITRNAPFGIWMTKQALQRNVDAPGMGAAIELENRTQVLATRTDDMSEALNAFRDRRPPRYTYG